VDRILIIGSGAIGAKHLSIAREVFPSAQIGWLSENLTAEMIPKDTKWFTDLEEALQFNPQITCVANAAVSHIKTALYFANINSHLLIEKPISHRTEGVQELIDLCESRNLVLAVGYNLRFCDSFDFFSEKIHSGAVGEVYRVQSEVGQYLPEWRPNIKYEFSVTAQRSLGGGALRELSHEIDYLQGIFGEVSWVQGLVATQSNLKIDVEDIALISLSFKTKSSEKLVIATVTMDLVRRDHVRYCEVIGELGTLKWDIHRGEVLLNMGTKWELIFRAHEDLGNSYKSQWAHLAICVRNNLAPKVSGVDALEVLKTLECVEESDHSGSRLYLSREKKV